MPNNMMVGIGSIVILFSTIVFGGVIGAVMGVLIVIAGAFAEGTSDESLKGPNFKLIIFGSMVVLASAVLIGWFKLLQVVAVIFGWLAMIVGLSLARE